MLGALLVCDAVSTFACIFIDVVQMSEYVQRNHVLLRQALQNDHDFILTDGTHSLSGEAPTHSVHTTVHCKYHKVTVYEHITLVTLKKLLNYHLPGIYLLHFKILLQCTQFHGVS